MKTSAQFLHGFLKAYAMINHRPLEIKTWKTIFKYYRVTFGKISLEMRLGHELSKNYLFGNSSQSVDVVIFEIILLLLLH